MANNLSHTLPAYVEQNHDSLLRDSILGAESAKMFTLQTGCKQSTALNLLQTAIQFQDGKGCGFNAAGSQEISQRTLTADLLKIDMEYCADTLLNTCLQHEVRIAAGQKKLPFENDFIKDVVDNVALGAETLIWQGDKTKTSDTKLKWTDGLIKILKANDGITVASQKLTHDPFVYGESGNGDVIAAVDEVVMALPTEVLNKAVIFMGYDTYRIWAMSWRNANMYHYDGGKLDDSVNIVPGSTIKVKPVAGLNGTGEIVAGDPRNFYYGVGDMSNENSKFDFWYSKDNDTFRLKIRFGLGTQVAFPNKVVISSVSA